MCVCVYTYRPKEKEQTKKANGRCRYLLVLAHLCMYVNKPLQKNKKDDVGCGGGMDGLVYAKWTSRYIQMSVKKKERRRL